MLNHAFLYYRKEKEESKQTRIKWTQQKTAKKNSTI